jgi:DMSO/TMAO reductase YedYZ heme-binding membrane subunit
MPRTSQSRVQTRRSPATASQQGRPLAPIVGGITLGAAVLTGAALSKPGVQACRDIYEFLEYYSGVFSLVALSITVMGGIAATERTVLRPHHRVQLQAVHRAMATLAMSFLGVHIATKIIESHVTALDVAVPFLADHRRAYVGLGTIAGYLMAVATWTGVSRARFAGSSKVRSWRILHSAAYVSWLVALTHGLESGRPARTWVWISYTLCLIFVAVFVAVRLAAGVTRRATNPRARTTGEIRATRRSRDALASVDEWPSGPLPPMAGVSAPSSPAFGYPSAAPASPAAGYPAPPAPGYPPPAPASPGAGHPSGAYPVEAPVTDPGPLTDHGTLYPLAGEPVPTAAEATRHADEEEIFPAPRPRRGPHDVPRPPAGPRGMDEHGGEAGGRGRRRQRRTDPVDQRPVDPMTDTLSRDSSDEEYLAFLRGPR